VGAVGLGARNVRHGVEARVGAERMTSKTESVDATRRTRLASERTELAWWRTGLTALAVALAVGRVIPGLDRGLARWPYALAGACFGIYGVAVIAYGSRSRSAMERALDEGHFPEGPRYAHAVLAAGGVALGLLTVELILIG
jgi:putative membrane protein